MKGLLILFVTIGTIAGGYVPALWGDSSGLSLWSILLGTVGGFIGLWLGWKFVNSLE